MSNIPSAAVSAAFTPVARATHEVLRARQVQSQKDSHHAEEVDELDDTAVNSVRDQQQRGQGGGGKQRKQQGPDAGENVDIEGLQVVPQAVPEPKVDETQLDISA